MCNDGLCFSQLFCSIGSVSYCRILEFHSTLGCERCSGKAHVCYRRDDYGLGHKQAEKGLARHSRNQEAEASGRRASCRLPRGETRRLLTLSRASVLPAVGCRHARCGPPGRSSMRPCSVQKYQCSRLLLRRFSVCRRVSNWEVIEPSRLTYLSKTKDMHVLAGHQWETQSDLAFRKAALSVLRGLGVSRQSAPFDVEAALEKVNKCGVQLPPGAPVGWGNFLVLATFFMMREIEAAAALAGHLEINVVTRTVSLKLPVTKADPRAVGCTRSWSCLCRGSELRQDCPYHSGVAQLELLQGKFGFPLPSGLPLFPTTDREVCTKAAIIKCLEATLSAFGVSTVAENGSRLFGGHSFRVAGAQRLATIGVEIAKIMVMARWAGSTVLRCVKEAPLANLSSEVVALEEHNGLVQSIQLLKAEFAALAEQVSAQAVGATSAHGRLQREIDEGLEKLRSSVHRSLRRGSSPVVVLVGTRCIWQCCC